MSIDFLKLSFNNSFASKKLYNNNAQNSISFGTKFNTGILNKDTVNFRGIWNYNDGGLSAY